MKTEYIAQFTTSEQYTECDWRPIRPTLKLSDETTIGEIREWMKQRGGERINEFTVIVTETTQPK